MPLPPIERTPNLRPLAAEMASLATGKVLPVAPVNPARQVAAPEELQPSVINMINQTDKKGAGESVYSSVADPVKKGAQNDPPSRDWTLHRPKPEKVEDPPPEPVSKILMDHLKSLWLASASAVQVQKELKDELELSQRGASQVNGVVATDELTYQPTKINPTEKPQT